MLIDAIMARLKERLPALEGRVSGVAELSVLQRDNRLPGETPAAYVYFQGARGDRAQTITGAHRQTITEQVTVVLVVTVTDDAAGARAAPAAIALGPEVIDALAGQSFGDYTPLEFSAAALLGIEHGTVFYKADFSTTRQLRIMS